MSAANNIFFGDMSRMLTQRPEETILIGRPTTDPKVLEEVAFRDSHGGMSRPEWDARIAQRRSDDEHANALRDLQGEPPEYDLRKKLSPQRTRYARYAEWLFRERQRLDGLEAKKAQFEAMIAAPAATEAEIRGLVRKAADRLMGRAKDEPTNGVRRELDDQLAEQRHAAEAAREALPELEMQIERARLRVAHLTGREDDFIKPAIVEIAEDAGLGQLYMDRLRALREVVDLISGLGKVAGGFGSGFGAITAVVAGERMPVNVEAVTFPTTGFKSLNAQRDDYAINTDGRLDVWRQLRQSLILNPYHRADSAFVIPPK